MHRLFRDSPLPRYVQLASLLRNRIAKGTLSPGERLPTLEELMKEFDVARVTVRQAVEVLAREGLVRAKQGSGTYVTARPAGERTLRLETTLQDLAAVYRGDKPRLTLLDESSAMPPLDPGDGKPAPGYRHLRRVHSRDGEPYCIITIYLDERVFARAPARFRKETIIPVMLDLKVRIARAHQTLRIGTADVETAERLGIALNSPTAEVRRIFRSAAGTVIYLGEVTYRGDYIRLEMDLKP